jgi:hypothetical protein
MTPRPPLPSPDPPAMRQHVLPQRPPPLRCLGIQNAPQTVGSWVHELLSCQLALELPTPYPDTAHTFVALAMMQRAALASAVLAWCARQAAACPCCPSCSMEMCPCACPTCGIHLLAKCLPLTSFQVVFLCQLRGLVLRSRKMPLPI